MTEQKFIDEIREQNLGYLMLAQRLIREDRDLAVYRLGISEELAGLLDSLSAAQVMQMAGSATLLCRFRYHDQLILRMTDHEGRERLAARTHFAILGAGQPVEAMA